MPTKKWSARECTVFLGTAPLTGLSDADDAIVVEYTLPRFMDPVLDKDGRTGMHVEETSDMIKATIKMKASATVGLARLQAIALAKQVIPFISGRHLHSATEAWTGQSAVLSEVGPLQGGKNPQDKVFVFTCISGTIVHGGPIVTPL